MCKSSSPPPPDYTPLMKASEHAADVAAQISREQLAENRRQYEDTKQILAPILSQNLQNMRQSSQQAADYFNYLKRFSRPSEKMMMAEAFGLDPQDIAALDAIQPEKTAPQEPIMSPSRTIDVPTQSIEMVPEKGAIKGSDLLKRGVDFQSFSYDMDGGFGGQWTGVNPIKPDVYYIKSGDNSWTRAQVVPKIKEGTKAVTIPGAPIPGTGGPATGLITKAIPVADLYAKSREKSLGRRNYDASQAIADTRAGTAQQQQQLIRMALRYGWSPQKVAAMAATGAAANVQNQVQAANAARIKREQLDWAKKLDVAGLYRNLPGASTAAYGAAAQAGQVAANARQNAVNQYMQGVNQANAINMQGQGLRIKGLGNVLDAQTGYAKAIASQPGFDVGGFLGNGAKLLGALKDVGGLSGAAALLS